MKQEQLTGAQEITVINVQTAAGFSVVPTDLSPELRRPVEALRSGQRLTKRQIVEMVEKEVDQNSRPY